MVPAVQQAVCQDRVGPAGAVQDPRPRQLGIPVRGCPDDEQLAPLRQYDQVAAGSDESSFAHPPLPPPLAAGLEVYTLERVLVVPVEGAVHEDTAIEVVAHVPV